VDLCFKAWVLEFLSGIHDSCGVESASTGSVQTTYIEELLTEFMAVIISAICIAAWVDLSSFKDILDCVNVIWENFSLSKHELSNSIVKRIF